MKNKKLIIDTKEIKDCFTFCIKSNKKNNFDFKETNFEEDFYKECISIILYDDNTFDGIVENDYCNSSFVHGKVMPNGVLTFLKIIDKNIPTRLNVLVNRGSYYGISIQTNGENQIQNDLNYKTSKYINAEYTLIEDKKRKLLKTKEILELKNKLLKSGKMKEKYDYVKQNINNLTTNGLLELREKLNTRFEVTIKSASSTIGEKDFDRTDFVYRDLLVGSDIWIPLRDELEFNLLSYLPKELTDNQKQNIIRILKK